MLCTLIAGALAVNLLAWAAFRLDKARARRGAWRIRERTLLAVAAAGGAVGALIAMYGHRRRHKVDKAGFAAIVWLALAAQLALVGWLSAR